jgi:diguanylate cyclase (GGDEF)-like protein/PAS domain S-box-containing protein
MDLSIFVDFFYNVLILMGMSIVYSIFKSSRIINPYIRKMIMGLMVSIMVAIVMLRSHILTEVDEGIMFDTRAVILSISGMFFGFIPTIMGMVTATVVRIWQGGVGAFTGTLWIIVSGTLGLLWRKYRLKNTDAKVRISWFELFIVGLVIQVIMVLLLLTLPREFAEPTINAVAFPILVIYPIGAYFVSQFLLIQRNQYFDEEYINKSEKQYKDLFNKSKSLLMLIDPQNYKIIDANEKCMEAYGYSFEEFKDMDFSKINILEESQIKHDLKAVFEDEKVVYQHTHIKKNGEIFNVEVHLSRVTLNDKEYIYHTAFDISEKIQSQKMFKDADERLKITLLSVGEGIVVTDEFERITVVNNKALDLLKTDRNLERRKVFDELRIYSNKNEKDFKTIYKECLKENTMFRSDNTYSLITNNDDEVIYIDFTISPINNELGINHGAIIVFRDVTIEKERQEEIRFMSRHDYLTGLYNRYHFEQELKRLDTSRQLPITLLIGDLNGLKLVNDAFGHLEGDRLIKETAHILKMATRTEDIVARWGGDEFAILLPQTSHEDAIKVKNRIVDLCKKSRYDVITPSVSVGCATKTSEEQSIDDILSAAEEIMYSNKLEEGPMMRDQLMDRIFKILNQRSPETLKHVDHIIKLVNKYCDFYNIGPKQRGRYILFAKYHDIGKIAIDEDILNKEGPLTDIEWKHMRTHSEIGSRIVATIPELQFLVKPILQQHENMDGSGYPRGTKGEAICEEARLLRILDSYEVMTNTKIYRDKVSHDEAINDLLKYANSVYDKDLLMKFIEIFKKDD